MGHGSDMHDAPPAALTPASAASVAATLQALATPSRLLILAALRREPRTVTQLAGQTGMEQSAVSHQLRLLRNLGLVTGTRAGKNIVYALYDNHVAALLDQAVYHSEHLRLGLRDTTVETVSEATAEFAAMPTAVPATASPAAATSAAHAAAASPAAVAASTRATTA